MNFIASRAYLARVRGYAGREMSKMSDRDYHELRARVELERADEASEPSIARVHRELAALHRRRLMELVDRVDPARLDDAASRTSESA